MRNPAWRQPRFADGRPIPAAAPVSAAGGTRHGIPFPALAALLLVGLAAIAPAEARDPNDGKTPSAAELNARREDLSTLRSQIDRLNRDISASESNRREAADDLRQSEKAISKLRREQHRLTRERRRLESRLRQLESESRQNAETLDSHRQRLSDLLRRQLRQGNVDPLRLALSGLPPAEASHNQLLLARIAAERARMASETRQALTRSSSLAAETRGERQQLDDLARQQRARESELARERKTHRQVVQKISKQLSQQKRTVDRLRRDERRLSDLVRKLDRLMNSRRTPRTAPQNLSRPLAGYAAYDRSTDFAKSLGALPRPVPGRSGRRAQELKGMFFPTPGGTEIVAVASGQVVFADWMRGFGNLMVIDHGENFMSIYGNNEALLAEVGDQVRSGESIATVGNSGGQSESGLYFELRFRGEAIDPGPWLKGP